MFSLTHWKLNGIVKKLKAMKSNRELNQPEDAVLKKEIALYFDLAERYKKLKHKKKFPYAQLMIIECYSAAASLDDAKAHYVLGTYFLEEAKYRNNLNKEGVFNSPANVQACQMAYTNAHAHLAEAEKLGHVLAKRIRGLSIINGWGVEADKNSGFELVVASIEQEGSWERVPQIFAEIGLNKPEFFAAIMQRRKAN